MSFSGQSPKANRLRLQPQSADPVNPAEGDLFYSDGTPRAEGLWIYKNTGWRSVKGDPQICKIASASNATLSSSPEVFEYTRAVIDTNNMAEFSAPNYAIRIKQAGIYRVTTSVFIQGNALAVQVYNANTAQLLWQKSLAPVGVSAQLSTNFSTILQLQANDLLKTRFTFSGSIFVFGGNSDSPVFLEDTSLMVEKLD